MTPDEAIAWWHGRIDYERRAPKPGDLKLDRMLHLLHLLGDPHHRLKLLHIAGTKGKGSSSAMLASILQEAGFSTGLFTSPHLIDVRERIQINDELISRERLAELLTRIRKYVEPLDLSGDIQQIPTFFEIVTAVGMLAFAEHPVDVAILEVGLGGRFDSTNVCMPLVSLITSISYDHMALLGNRLDQIAFEKAGIIKPGRPVVSTATAVEAKQVIEKVARERGSRLTSPGADFSWEYQTDNTGNGSVRVTLRGEVSDWLKLGLLGEHQAGNAAGVLAVVEELRTQGWIIPETAIHAGFRLVDWPARMEVVQRQPLILLDCAHNVASIQSLVDTLRRSLPVTGRKYLILAVSADKQIPEMLAILAGDFDHFLLTRYASNPRYVPPEDLAETLRAIAPKAEFSIHATAPEALEAAKKQAKADDLIAITGSVFLAGELRMLLLKASEG